MKKFNKLISAILSIKKSCETFANEEGTPVVKKAHNLINGDEFETKAFVKPIAFFSSLECLTLTSSFNIFNSLIIALLSTLK